MLLFFCLFLFSVLKAHLNIRHDRCAWLNEGESVRQLTGPTDRRRLWNKCVINQRLCTFV